jgi:tetratricopeptide (TPR) repeat protein
MAARVGLVDIVRDFVVVHHRFRALFEQFRAGTLHFEDVKHLVADGDSSVLFRLKERVHGLFRDRDPELPLRRGEALFDLAVGSLFHEALKFRENLYQLEVYGPKVRALRDQAAEDVDGLLAEFEKILRAASDRLGESLRETETLLEQTRRQLPGLLTEAAAAAPDGVEVGLVTRFVLAERESVEGVYPEGVHSLLAGVHEDGLSAYLCAVRSHLESAHFQNAQRLIDEARELARKGADSCPEIEYLAAYAAGMQAFRHGRYSESVAQLGAWLETPDRTPEYVALAKAVLGRLPKLVDPAENAELLSKARKLCDQLAA